MPVVTVADWSLNVIAVPVASARAIAWAGVKLEEFGRDEVTPLPVINGFVESVVRVSDSEGIVPVSVVVEVTTPEAAICWTVQSPYAIPPVTFLV